MEGERFRELGFSVRLTVASGDHRVDLIATREGEVSWSSARRPAALPVPVLAWQRNDRLGDPDLGGCVDVAGKCETQIDHCLPTGLTMLVQLGKVGVAAERGKRCSLGAEDP